MGRGCEAGSEAAAAGGRCCVRSAQEGLVHVCVRQGRAYLRSPVVVGLRD